MKINMNEIHQYFEQGNLKELSRRTGIKYRTMQDWKGNQSGWLLTATKRFEDMQKAITDIKNEFEVNGVTHRFYDVSNMSKKDKERYTATVVIDDYEKSIEIPKMYAMAYLDRNILTDDMDFRLENQLDFEFTDNPYIIKFGKDEYLTSSLRNTTTPSYSLGHYATNVRTGVKTFFFSNNRQGFQAYIIREVYEALDEYSFNEIMDHLKEEYDFTSFAEASDKLLYKMMREIDGFYI